MSATLTHPPQSKSSTPTAKPGYYSWPIGQEAVEFYRENGFLVITNGIPEKELAHIHAETLRLCRNADGKVNGVDPAPAEMSDEDALRRVLCIHFPHKLSSSMYATLAQPSIVDVLTQVVSPNVKAMQSMLFIKAAGKPGQAWHQDEDYIPTRDRSLTGAWIALDRATVENGCLWVIPGSHKQGILWDQEWHGDRRFDCALQSVNFPYTDKDEIPVEVEAGAIVFFNGYLLHRSLPNRAKSGFRRALVNHYMSAESFLPWHKPKDGEPFEGMGKLDYRDIVLVAGKDPYAHRGVRDIAGASVRPSGEGGCISWHGGKSLPYKDEK